MILLNKVLFIEEITINKFKNGLDIKNIREKQPLNDKKLFFLNFMQNFV
jgi:hypothetical protein